MSVTDLSVHKPAAITMVILLLLGLGIFGYINMGADLLPAMDIPVIAVITTYPGAGAEAVEKDVVKPVEDALSGISGIDTMNSSVQEGYGQTVIQFTMETDMNTALMDVQKAMDTVGAELPSNAEKPVIYKFDPGAISILTLSLSGSGSYEELYNEADKIKTKIEKLPGIGQVSIRGGKEKNLIISLDKTALDYYGINLNVLLGKLKSENMTMSAGII
jgi:HAE1 family hydrophobic/amphiphilic exporter-1